jgi:alpha-L-fucosidase 2
MLVQSHTGTINVLPALPFNWNTGNVKGIPARGVFTINMDWLEGKISNLSVASEAGNICRVKIPEIRVSQISSNGKEIPFTPYDNYIEFKTRPE